MSGAAMPRSLIHRVSHWATAFLVIGVVCLSSGAGVIAVKPPPTAAETAAAEFDLVLTLRARRALALDPELAPLNLGVRIRNHVATLLGPVPTAELSFKAEVCLRGLVELFEVRNELWVT